MAPLSAAGQDRRQLYQSRLQRLTLAQQLALVMTCNLPTLEYLWTHFCTEPEEEPPACGCPDPRCSHFLEFVSDPPAARREYYLPTAVEERILLRLFPEEYRAPKEGWPCRALKRRVKARVMAQRTEAGYRPFHSRDWLQRGVPIHDRLGVEPVRRRNGSTDEGRLLLTGEDHGHQD